MIIIITTITSASISSSSKRRLSLGRIGSTGTSTSSSGSIERNNNDCIQIYTTQVCPGNPR